MAQMFQTLARTLKPHERLRIACEFCGRTTDWPRADAMRRLGPDTKPFQLRPRLRCSGCGKRESARVSVV
jgi:hypothetical protein